MQIDISDIAGSFPEFRVGVVKAENLTIVQERPSDLDRLIGEYEIECRRRWSEATLSEIPGIAVWRRAYRSFGIKRTSYRSSVERLVKNALAGRALPVINSFVDVYNAVSLAHVMPAGADDLDHVAGDIAFRYSRPDDSFIDMARSEKSEADNGRVSYDSDPPKQGEVVYADSDKVLCRRWNWRQDARSLVRPMTTRAVVTIQFNGAGNLDDALRDLADSIVRFAGGVVDVVVADRNRPKIAIG